MTKYTLITGASEGLGAKFAHIAAKAGRPVILTARSEDKLTALAGDLRGHGIDTVVIPADLSRMDEAERLWAEATDGREIDVLVNNAGLGYNGPFQSNDAWEREHSSIAVNVMAFSYLMKRAIPHMDAHGGGRVLNVASTAGFMPGPNMAVYHATKAYALSLSEAVAEELKGSSVSVTALCPGATATNFFEDAQMEGVRLLKFGKPMDAHKVAEEGWLEARIAKRVVVPGMVNKMFAFLPRVAPRSATARIAKTFLSKG